jgi:hypothetical protein
MITEPVTTNGIREPARPDHLSRSPDARRRRRQARRSALSRIRGHHLCERGTGEHMPGTPIVRVDELGRAISACPAPLSHGQRPASSSRSASATSSIWRRLFRRLPRLDETIQSRLAEDRTDARDQVDREVSVRVWKPGVSPEHDLASSESRKDYPGRQQHPERESVLLRPGPRVRIRLPPADSPFLARTRLRRLRLMSSQSNPLPSETPVI